MTFVTGETNGGRVSESINSFVNAWVARDQIREWPVRTGRDNNNTCREKKRGQHVRAVHSTFVIVSSERDNKYC